jgi:hypothetical protein
MSAEDSSALWRELAHAEVIYDVVLACRVGADEISMLVWEATVRPTSNSMVVLTRLEVFLLVILFLAEHLLLLLLVHHLHSWCALILFN